MDDNTPPVPGATPESERIVLLDVLRGLALFGIFVVNLPYLAGPETALELDVARENPLDLAAWVVTKLFFELRMVTLFSFLFGVGLVLQMRRAAESGRSFGRVYLVRLFTLALMGVLHGTLLFYGDILLPYAVAGFVLFLARGASPRNMLRVAIGLFGIGIVLSLLVSFVPDVRNEDWYAFEEVAFTEGPLGKTIAARSKGYAGWLFLSTLISFNWRVLALFFLGAAACKRRLFEADHTELHRRLARVWLPAGLIASAVAVGLALSGSESTVVILLSTLLNELGSLAWSFGLMGLIALAVHAGGLRRQRRGLAAAGRLALTNYIGQSVIANALFLWYGLGLWGDYTLAPLLCLAVAIFAFQVVASLVWLHFFRAGPLEWLWRSVTYGRLQPLRR